MKQTHVLLLCAAALLLSGCKSTPKETATPAPVQQGLSDEDVNRLLEGTAVSDSTALIETGLESEPLGEE